MKHERQIAAAHLVIFLALVQHGHQSDGTSAQKAHGHDRLLHQHQNVLDTKPVFVINEPRCCSCYCYQWIVVFAKRLWNEAATVFQKR